MKQLFLTACACLIASFAAFAQPSNTILIDNQLGCNVYLEIHGVTSGSTTCPGVPASTSGKISIPAMTFTGYNNTTDLPGTFTGGDLFAYVEVFEDAFTTATACGGNGANSYSVGECAAPVAGPVTLYETNAANTSCLCTSMNVNISWNSGSNTLTIN